MRQHQALVIGINESQAWGSQAPGLLHGHCITTKTLERTRGQIIEVVAKTCILDVRLDETYIYRLRVAEQKWTESVATNCGPTVTVIEEESEGGDTGGRYGDSRETGRPTEDLDLGAILGYPRPFFPENVIAKKAHFADFDSSPLNGNCPTRSLFPC